MNRREVLLASGSAGAVSSTTPEPVISTAADLSQYFGFGAKQSGGPGDQASGAWLESRLESLGYRTRRQGFRVPFFDPEVRELRVEGHALEVWPQAPWRVTSPAGVEGRLVRWTPGVDVGGAIVVIVLTYRRWSAFRSPEVEPAVRAALAGRAAAVVLVTTGPTGEALALNVALESPAFSAPVAILAPKAAGPVLMALDTGAHARLTVTGVGGERPAFNVAGRIDRGADRWLVISTPRSGWFGCAGERGGGVAVWLALAAWVRHAAPRLNLLMTSASGHEREYAGAKLFLKEEAPPPARTAFWLHLGANVAARDWHEAPGRLTPLPSADPQRQLVVERGLLTAARRAFEGQPGLERPYASDELSDGELGEVLQAGYRAAGVFGAHRFHHAAADDLRCVEAAHVEAACRGFRDLLSAALAA